MWGCFWRHDWDRWQTIDEVNLTWRGKPCGFGEKQRKECKRCGKVKLRIAEGI